MVSKVILLDIALSTAMLVQVTLLHSVLQLPRVE